MRNIILASCLLLAGNAAVSAQPPFGLSDDEIKQAMRQPAPPRLTFAQLVLGAQDAEHQREKHDDPEEPPGGKVDMPRPEAVLVIPAEPKFVPPFVASQECGMIILVAGVLGWISLGVAVLVVENRQPKPQ
ncbi:MAG TPA: hypothetical protein VFE62_25315 [Gemmataceae bacterium]|nr:hypothetical protein [Gemmataceae bacterium]